MKSVCSPQLITGALPLPGFVFCFFAGIFKVCSGVAYQAVSISVSAHTHTGIREKTSCWKTLVAFVLEGKNFPAEGKTKCPGPYNFLSCPHPDAHKAMTQEAN